MCSGDALDAVVPGCADATVVRTPLRSGGVKLSVVGPPRRGGDKVVMEVSQWSTAMLNHFLL